MKKPAITIFTRLINKSITSVLSMTSTAPTRAQVDLSNMRKPYRDHDEGIDESKLPTLDPIKLFANWFDMVKQSDSVYEPNAFSISTVNRQGRPSSRMVLLKGFGDNGFTFFTHYTSRKGTDIDENPNVALLFYWDSINRQVRIEGRAQKLPEEVGESYFKRRPQLSQIGAAISDQKSLISSRDELMSKYNSLKAQLGDNPPPKPKTWGGYLVVPDYFEFWQGNTNRVHDRLVFRHIYGALEPIDEKLTKKAENGWYLERILP